MTGVQTCALPISVNDAALAKKLETFRAAQTEKARAMNLPGHS